MKAYENGRLALIQAFVVAQKNSHVLSSCNSAALSRYDEIWSEEAESHAYEAVQVIKLRKSKTADDNILKTDIPPYLRRESSKVDEMWYTNTNFDTFEETLQT